MKIIEINGGTKGSTGKIMYGIKKYAESKGYNIIVSSPVTSNNRSEKRTGDFYNIGNYISRKINVFFSQISGLEGCFAIVPTIKFIKFLKKESPDLLHLHTLHNSYINLPILFRYIKKYDVPVIWTLHDCWTFTGHCPHFTYEKCEKWKTGCHSCPRYKEYPKSFFDNSKYMWNKKRKWFSGVKNMTIVTPSKWLGSLVSYSFLREYPIKVINNGIDINLFKPIDSMFRAEYGLEDKKIVLGVAFGWGERKGLDIFVKLSQILPSSYKIVLVGTDSETDKRIPENILSIHCTNNQQQLAEIYASADVFVNPTREDNYPTVNMESIACGTPVITFNTGGSPEMIDEADGIIVGCEDINAMLMAIIDICESHQYDNKTISAKALEFDETQKYKEYICLYEDIKN